MVELIDNLLQTLSSLAAFAGGAILFSRRRKLPYFLLTCFYGLFTLGTLYWTLHYALLNETPSIFYISDIPWVASFVFLLLLEQNVSTDEEKKTRHPIRWLVPLLFGLLTLYYCTHGDILSNLCYYAITASAAWYAVGGLIHARRQGNPPGGRGRFHLSVLIILVLEHCLWTASCFWVSDTLTNPYFWFDFMLSASFWPLLGATGRVVGE